MARPIPVPPPLTTASLIGRHYRRLLSNQNQDQNHAEVRHTTVPPSTRRPGGWSRPFLAAGSPEVKVNSKASAHTKREPAPDFLRTVAGAGIWSDGVRLGRISPQAARRLGMEGWSGVGPRWLCRGGARPQRLPGSWRRLRSRRLSG